MNQLKAGELALIVGTVRESSPNMGRCVMLVELVPPGHQFVTPNGTRAHSGSEHSVWLCQAEGLKAWWDSHAVWVDAGDICLCDPQHLMPLRGDFAPTEQKSQEVPA